MTFFLGLVLGFVREFLVVRYYGFLALRKALSGSIVTLLLGFLDFFIIANFIQTKSWGMVIGYISGESLGTLIGIKYGRRNNQ